MKVSIMNANRTIANFSRKNVDFKSLSNTQNNNDESNEYIKISKSEYNSNKWGWRILWMALVIEIICFLLTKKTEQWKI